MSVSPEDEEIKYTLHSSYDLGPYIPASLSEIVDHLTSMIGGAPNFTSKHYISTQIDINLEFYMLTKGLGKSRKKLGDELYARLIELASQAKQLFLEDPEETNGKTMQGIRLIHEMTDLIDSVRSRRVKAGQKDEEGRITGD